MKNPPKPAEEKICPLKMMTSRVDQRCIGKRCAWWDTVCWQEPEEEE